MEEDFGGSGVGDVTLHTIDTLGGALTDRGEYEEAKEVHERCLAVRMKVIGEDHQATCATMSTLGISYMDLKNYEKAVENYKEL